MDTENVKLENENYFGSKLSNTFQFLGFFFDFWTQFWYDWTWSAL